MTGEYVWDPGEANPKQKLFFASRKLYTAYGGREGRRQDLGRAHQGPARRL